MNTSYNKPNKTLDRAARFFQEGKFDRASDLCKKLLAKNPDDTAALGMQGVMHAMRGDVCEAERLFRRAIRVQPDNPALNKNLAKTLIAAEKYEDGLKYYTRVVSLLPGDADARYDLACASLKSGNTTDAEAGFRQALKLNPAHAGAHTNLGGIVREQGRFGEAIGHYRSALAISPHLPEALSGIGLTLQEAGLLDDARRYLDTAIRLHPSDADAHFNLALCHLLAGNYEDGWREYEWRWKRATKQARHFDAPLWDGTSLAGRNILVFAEQGIGDEIMFASCLPDILAQANHVVIDCEPRLAPLFERSFPEATVHGGYQNENGDWLKDCCRIDVQIPIGSLPRFLRTGTDAFTGSEAYLRADPDRQADWNRMLQDTGPGMKIGLSWKGGGTNLARLMRSIELPRWNNILSQEGMQFISLQYGDCRQEISAVQESCGTSLHEFATLDPMTDLDGFAALISGLDLVISIDNSTAHLAGALGVQTWLLLPPVPDWRWTMHGERTPWYPSLRLFRRSQGETPDAQLARIAQELKILAGR